MKILFVLTTMLVSSVGFAQAITASAPQPDKNKKLLEVEASCGQCRLGLKGTDCDLAVRIEGKAYFVDGSNIDSHGDAHATDGFCNAIRKAQVQGEIVDNRFKATYFLLLPDNKKKKQ